MTTRRTDLPQGTLDLLVLQVAAAGPIHGYGIAQRIEQISLDVLQVRQGSLYPALHRLQRDGLIEGLWRTSPGGQHRRYYAISDRGVQRLEQGRAEWLNFSRAVNMIISNASS